MEEPSFKNLIQEILKEATGQALRLEVIQSEGEITLNKPAAGSASAPVPQAPDPIPASPAPETAPPAPGTGGPGEFSTIGTGPWGRYHASHGPGGCATSNPRHPCETFGTPRTE